MSMRSRHSVPKGTYFLVHCHEAGRHYYALSLDNRGAFFGHSFRDSRLKANDLNQLVELLSACEHGTSLMPVRVRFQSNDPTYSIEELTPAEVQQIRVELEKASRSDISVFADSWTVR